MLIVLHFTVLYDASGLDLVSTPLYSTYSIHIFKYPF
jgi:hypothetical protein